MMGEPFFDCQIGFVGCRALCLKGIMGVRDFEENMNRREEVKKKIGICCSEREHEEVQMWSGVFVIDNNVSYLLHILQCYCFYHGVLHNLQLISILYQQICFLKITIYRYFHIYLDQIIACTMGWVV